MAQTLYAAAGAANNNFPADTSAFTAKPIEDFGSSRLAQLIALAEAEFEQRVAPRPSQEDVMLEPILAPIASYHHHSEYNRSKLGSNPARICGYIPLSIQFPSHVKLLREKQASMMSNRVFYSASQVKPDPENAHAVTPSQSLRSPLISVDRKPRSAEVETPPLPYKSLEPETIPSSDSLDHLAAVPGFLETKLSLTSRQVISHAQPCLGQSISGPRRASQDLSDVTDLSTPKTSFTHPINVATLIPWELLPQVAQKLTANPFSKPIIFTLPPGETLLAYLMNQSTAHSANATTITLTTLNQLQHVSKQAVPELSISSMMQSPTTFFQQAWNAVLPNAFRAGAAESPITNTASHPGRMSMMLPSGPVASARSLAGRAEHRRTMSIATRELGNLLISSCPGKKVRLNGEHKTGRQAICRDLAVDLTRMKSLGVCCIVCCLDDDELEFLGVPWDLYYQSASALGLDVLRIPMPEGLCPLNPAYLDEQIEKIIRNYTLRGLNVLTHCRGGVGRAGLFACCWSIKLGLCGPIISADAPPPGYVRRDALAMVEIAVGCVRVRRSLKAIETYEQVKFLIEFVEHLRSKAPKTR